MVFPEVRTRWSIIRFATTPSLWIFCNILKSAWCLVQYYLHSAFASHVVVQLYSRLIHSVIHCPVGNPWICTSHSYCFEWLFIHPSMSQSELKCILFLLVIQNVHQYFQKILHCPLWNAKSSSLCCCFKLCCCLNLHWFNFRSCLNYCCFTYITVSNSICWNIPWCLNVRCCFNLRYCFNWCLWWKMSLMFKLNV